MITLFSVPKPFTGRVAAAQKNALASWLRLAPDVQVILFGDEEGIGEAAAGAGAEHVGDVARNDFGTPLLDGIFRSAQARARHPLCCYINADIVLFEDFARAARRLDLPRFVAVGRRTDLDVDGAIDFSREDWAARLRDQAVARGRLHEPTGIDYFLFPRGAVAELPPFPVGRVLWDNWMIHSARSRAVPVVDLTSEVMVVHQNHDYGHVVGGAATIARGVEAQRNWQVVGPYFYQMTIDDATWVLDGTGVHPARDLRHRIRQLLVAPALSPRFRWSVAVARYLYQRLVLARR